MLFRSEPLTQFKIGKALPLRKGSDAAIFATGAIAEAALIAAEALDRAGYSIGVYSFPTVKPIDRELIIEQMQTARLSVTVEEHNIIGGLGSAVAEVMAEAPAHQAILHRIGVRDTFATVVGSKAFLKKHYGMDAGAIEDAVRKYLD